MYRSFLPDSSVTKATAFTLAGTAIEEGAYDAEKLLGVEEIDTSCVKDFYPLIQEVIITSMNKHSFILFIMHLV